MQQYAICNCLHFVFVMEMAPTAILLIPLSTRRTGDFIYCFIINYWMQLALSYVYQAVLLYLLYLLFCWHL